MTRFSDDPLVDEIRELERWLEELKTAQRIGGRSIIGHLTHSEASYDHHLLLPTGLSKHTLTFTHDHPQSGGQIQQLALFFAFTTNVMADYVPPWANGSDVVMFLQKKPPTDMESIWKIGFRNDDAGPLNIYLKLFFSGTDSGTWQLT